MSISSVLSEFVSIGIEQEQIYSKIGIASEIDLDKYTFTFTPSDGGAQVLDAQLKTAISSFEESFIVVPKEGSLVIVTFIEKENGFLSHAKEASRIIINSDLVKADAQSWVFNGGDLGGLIKIEQLVSKINALEDKVNSLSTSYNNHIHPYPGLPGLTATTTIPSVETLSKTTVSELEDAKIKH